MHWYDTRESKLVTGESAYEVAMENSQVGDVRPLADVVLQKELDFPVETVGLLDTSDWDREDFVRFGHWTIEMLSLDQQFEGLARRHIERLHKLGIGFGRYSLQKEFGMQYGNYIEALGVESARDKKSEYAYWTRRDFATHALEITQRLGHPPTTDDFDSQKGPSSRTMTKYAGTPGEINELNGYPNIYSWDSEQYISWGARVMLVNNGATLTNRLLTYISKKKYGPATRTIVDEFGSLPEFQRLVTERFETDPASSMPRNSTATKKLTELRSKKLLNTWHMKYIAANDIAISYVAKYDVTKDLLPDVDELEYGYIAAHRRRHLFVEQLLAKDPSLCDEDIKLAAIATGHTDDIWKLSDRWRSELSVTPQKLKYKRKKNAQQYGPPRKQ